MCFLLAVACSDSPTTVQKTDGNQPAANAPAQKRDERIVSSHSQDEPSETRPDAPSPNSDATVVPKSGEKTKWTQSGNPIDTTSYDEEIARAESALKKSPKDEAVKKSLAEAFVKRGVALTDARQYASALGDYRRALKHDPENEEAKKWIAQIIAIYDSINRTYPAEGEEPPPLPFKKDK
jgi:tetratricopeptide (TPR) repeat protein